jgi:hypothetical protein
MKALSAILLLTAVAVAAETQPAGPQIADRPGGLLACQELPGFARVMRAPEPIIVPRADGSPTALCFVGFAEAGKQGMHVVYCDLVAGKTRVEALPAGFTNPWGQVWGPDGKLYFGLWAPATVLRYDPVADKLDQFGVIEPDIPYKGVCVMTVGTDEKVYAIAGGYAFSIDPATDKVARFGHQGPKRKFPVAYTGTLAVDDEYIYSTFGNVASEIFTVAANKATGEQTMLKEIQGAKFQQERLGVTANAGGKDYWMVKGKPVLKQSADEPSPWQQRELPPRKAEPKLKAKPDFVAGLRQADGSCKVRYRPGPDQPWQTMTLSLPSDPINLSRIFTLSDGRIVASTWGYEGLNCFEPETNAFSFLGMLPQSNYSNLVVGDKAYLAGYPGGSGCYVWEPAKPWTIGDPLDRPATSESRPAQNPRQLEQWARSGNFQFPLLMVQGADKAIYAAIHGERSHAGAVLSWREIDTGKQGHLQEPFETYDPCGLCTALGGTKIVMSTFAVRGAEGQPRPESGRLFVIDTATRKVDWFIDPLPGVDLAGFVVETKPGKLVLAGDHRTGWDTDRWKQGKHEYSCLCTVDMETRKVTRVVKLPGLLACRREYGWHTDFKLGPDGMIYTFYDDALVRIDPETLAITAISKVAPIGCITFAGSDIYLSGTPHFRRVVGAVGPAKP